MHDMESSVIWFAYIIAGVILTMLLPRLVSVPSRRGRTHHEWKDMPVRGELDEQLGSMVMIGNVPDVHLVSTSWAWSIPLAASEQDVLGHDQARLMVPPSVQQAYATSLERKEIGS